MSVRLSHVSATVLVPSESLLISGLDLSQLKALDRPQDHPLPNDVSKVPAIVGCCTWLGGIAIQIVIETLVALLLGILGAVLNTPPLKEITWSSEMKYRW